MCEGQPVSAPHLLQWCYQDVADADIDMELDESSTVHQRIDWVASATVGSPG